jgi:glycine dehydrogenase subunit 1
VVVQYPNFFGCLEDVRAAGEIAHAKGALLVVAADPVNLGFLTPPGALRRRHRGGEGQGLGVPMSYRRPQPGRLRVSRELVRRMPGRLVGATVDRDGHAASSSRSRRASSTSAARRPPRTSAPTSRSAR